MEPLHDDLRRAAVDYAKALNAYAATIAAQVTDVCNSVVERVVVAWRRAQPYHAFALKAICTDAVKLAMEDML